MAGERARMVLTDPPYNVPIAGHVRGKGSHRLAEFAFASGEMSVAEFRRFLGEAFGQMVRVSEDGAVHMVFMDWRHLGDALAAGEGLWSDLLNICVWSKTNAGMGSLYRSQHEMVLVAKAGSQSLEASRPGALFPGSLMRGDGKTVGELAEEHGVGSPYFTRILRLGFLAPPITSAILDGRQPIELSAKRLADTADLAKVRPDARTRLRMIRTHLLRRMVLPPPPKRWGRLAWRAANLRGRMGPSGSSRWTDTNGHVRRVPPNRPREISGQVLRRIRYRMGLSVARRDGGRHDPLTVQRCMP